MVKEDAEVFGGLVSLPAFPIVLVTVNRNIMTAAAFSFYSFQPPSVMVGIRPENLTCELIAKRREFGINLPTTAQLDSVRVCGSVSGRDEDKFTKTGLTPQKGKQIGSYLIQECPVSLECQVVHEVKFGGSHQWFIGQILAAYIDTEYTREKALMYWLSEYRKVGEIILKVKRK